MKIKYIFSLFSKMKTCRTGQCSNTKTAFLPLLIIVFLSLGSASLLGQDCNVGNVSYCYDNNENTVITYCPDDPLTQKIAVTINDYAFDSAVDSLNVYDGTGIGGTLLGQLSSIGNNSTVAYIATAQAEGGDGCLTLNIISDATRSCISGELDPTNWDVSCEIHCTSPTAVLIADTTISCSTEADNQAVGVNVNFDASTSTPATGGSLTSYEWHFGDGTVQTTTIPTIDYTYSSPGGYSAFLIVTDSLGCNSTNLAEQFIQLSGAPAFSISSDASASGVCQGDSFNLMGNHTAYTWTEEIQQPNAPATTLPDGTGATFESSVFFTQFGQGDVIADGTNLMITINIEHSSMQDLLMELVCPDGTRVMLLGDQNNMGSSRTGGSSGTLAPPGPGLDYVFSMSAATLFNTNTYDPSQNVPSGSYRPDGDFANINGCPMNGEWKLEITDNLPQDDGTLFSWDITLNAGDESNRVLESFTNNYAPAVWTGDGLTGTTARPTTEGTHTYTYTVSDNFGCEYSESLDVTVLSSRDSDCNEAPMIGSSPVFFIPENSVSVVDVQSTDDNDSEGNGLSYSFTGTSVGEDEHLFTIDSDDGEIRLIAVPDYESPNDVGMNNQYAVGIEVCDVENACTRQLIYIYVTDIDEDNDGYIGVADPNDSDPCDPDPQNDTCQQDCNAQAPIIGGN